jgi:hypothetical protein
MNKENALRGDSRENSCIPKLDCCLEVSMDPQGTATCLLDQTFHGFPLSSSKCWSAIQNPRRPVCFSWDFPKINLKNFAQTQTLQRDQAYEN